MLTLADVVRERNDRNAWGATEELLAQLIELLSVVRIEAWLIAGVPRHKLPKAHQVTRPGEQEQEAEMVVTPSEFARMTMVR